MEELGVGRRADEDVNTLVGSPTVRQAVHCAEESPPVIEHGGGIAVDCHRYGALAHNVGAFRLVCHRHQDAVVVKSMGLGACAAHVEAGRNFHLFLRPTRVAVPGAE